MNDSAPQHDDAFDGWLRERLQAEGEPGDAGFSLRVMSALPPQPTPQGRRWVRRLRQAQWLAVSLAACTAAALLCGAAGPLDGPHALAALALVGLMIFWLLPNRWHRG